MEITLGLKTADLGENVVPRARPHSLDTTTTTGKLLRLAGGREYGSRWLGFWGRASFTPCPMGPAQVRKWVNNLVTFKIPEKEKSCVSFLVRAWMDGRTRGWLFPVVNVGIQPPQNFLGPSMTWTATQFLCDQDFWDLGRHLRSLRSTVMQD